MLFMDLKFKVWCEISARKILRLVLFHQVIISEFYMRWILSLLSGHVIGNGNSCGRTVQDNARAHREPAFGCIRWSLRQKSQKSRTVAAMITRLNCLWHLSERAVKERVHVSSPNSLEGLQEGMPEVYAIPVQQTAFTCLETYSYQVRLAYR
jgi:hypothetical protein